jgi:hypothetical protein
MIHLDVKRYEGMEVYIHEFLISALGGEWWTLHSGRFTPGERTPATRRKEARWAPVLAWKRRRGNLWPLPEIELHAV